MVLAKTDRSISVVRPRVPGGLESHGLRLKQVQLKQTQPIVVYVDPRALSRESIGRWLATRLPSFHVHLEGDDHAAVAFAASSDRTALVLRHIGAARASSPEVAATLVELVEQLGTVPVAVLADAKEVDVVTAALRCGVRGYLPTGLQAAVVVEAVRLICAGDIYAPVASLLGQSQKPPPPAVPALLPPAMGDFSPRQRQILNWLRQGMANKNIAHAMNLSEATVKVHVRNIMKKLRATNRTQVVLMTMPPVDTMISDNSEAR